jgi:hypothetical protein
MKIYRVRLVDWVLALRAEADDFFLSFFFTIYSRPKVDEVVNEELLTREKISEIVLL